MGVPRLATTTSTTAAPVPLVVLEREASDADAPDAVYLGTGVTARAALATGDLPLDALGMMVVADRVRRIRGATRVVHLIADTHAVLVGRDTADVERVAAKLETRVRHAAAAIGLDAYEVVRASQVTDLRHADLVAQAIDMAGPAADPYAVRQAADVEWVRETYGATVKVGWTMATRLRDAPRGTCERYFDDAYRELFGDRVSTVYIGPGRRVDAQPGTSPYTHLDGDVRLTLTSTTDQLAIVLKSRSMRTHLRPLVRTLRDALGLRPDDHLTSATAELLNFVRPDPLDR